MIGNYKDSRISYIDSLKFFLAAFVVLIHSKVYIAEPSDRTALFESVVDLFSSFVLSNVVPTFFVISGVLFFKDGASLSRNIYLRKIKTRVRTLLIPYILWNTIGLVAFAVKKNPQLSSMFPQYSDISISFHNILAGYFAIPDQIYPYDMPLWFIRDLIIVVFFTPIIGYFISRLKFSLILLEIACVCCIDSYLEDSYGMLPAFFFFTLGGIIGSMNMRILNSRYAALTFVAYIALYAACEYIIPKGGLCETIASLLKTSVAVVAIIKLIHMLTPNKFRMNPSLYSSAFFIFAFHGLFCSVISKGISIAMPVTNSFMGFIDYIAIFSILFGSSLAVFYIMKRISPALLKILIGGRC